MARVMLFDLSLLTELNLSSRCVRLRESIGYFRVAFIVRFDMSAFALSAGYCCVCVLVLASCNRVMTGSIL